MNNRLLAIDPHTFRQWLDEAKPSLGLEAARMVQSPEAAARLQPSRKNIGAIGVVGISGFITQKPTIWSVLFGGTSTDMLVSELRQLAADKSVESIVLNVDSPGGSVFGLAEAAAAIRDIRKVKPIVSVANPVMASAAYYLAAQADEIVATPSAVVGSIGTIAIIEDWSGAMDKAGVKLEVFTFGERKAEGMPPLDDAAREAIQAEVDYYGEMFESDVSKGRGISRSTVRNSYGQGAVFNARPAVDAGLADRIGTLEDVIGELAAGRAPKPKMAASGIGLEQVRWRLALGLRRFDGQP